MSRRLSPEELERIRAFANRPRHKRTPDELLPEEAEEDPDYRK
jgi:hypothetical protein